MFLKCSLRDGTLTAMQYSLAIDNRSAVLVRIHDRLRAHFGRPGPFRQLDPVSQLVLGMIGGRTYSAVSRAAFGRLAKRFMPWERLSEARAEAVLPLMRDVTYAEIKAPRIIEALGLVRARRGALSLDFLGERPVEEALAWLERLPGVGRKSAATVLNFSTLRMRALVIDTHHRRVLQRLGLLSTPVSFRQAYDGIMPALPDAWGPDRMDDHHQLLKGLGQTFCRHEAPNCGPCPLLDLCPTGQKRRP